MVQSHAFNRHKHRRSRFLSSDNQKSRSPSNQPAKVVFLGDSIVDLWRNFGFFPNKPNYINAGISGDKTSDMLDRFDRDVLSVRPEVVIIAGGGNDILNGFDFKITTRNLKALVSLAWDNGIKVILANITPGCNYDILPGSWEALSSRNKWIKNFCKENNIVCLDYFSSLVDQNNLYKEGYVQFDCIHPTKLAYDVMAPLAEEAIQKVLQGSNNINSNWNLPTFYTGYQMEMIN